MPAGVSLPAWVSPKRSASHLEYTPDLFDQPSLVRARPAVKALAGARVECAGVEATLADDGVAVLADVLLEERLIGDVGQVDDDVRLVEVGVVRHDAHGSFQQTFT